MANTQWKMKAQLAHELHRPARRNYPTRKTVVKGMRDLTQIDLVEMQLYSRFNSGYRYIMTIINCFTKVAYAIPLKNKSGPLVASALDPFFRKHRTKHLQTDSGREFYNKHVQDVLKKHKINHYSTYSSKKAAVVERFNRTLKEMMWREFTAQGNYKWLALLPKLLKRYNSTFHRAIGMTPKSVTSKNENVVLSRLATPFPTTKRTKFTVGDPVRISKVKRLFEKGYVGNWSQELFKIFSVNPTVPTTYTLEDLKGELIKGGFYEHELLKARVRDVFFVDKIIRRKGDKALVRWKGYSKDFDSWIDLKESVVK